MTYLQTFRELDSIYTKLDEISSAHQAKVWANEVNVTECKNGLKYEFNLLLFLALVVVGLLIIGTGTYLSENVIRGIYNEEI